MQGDPLSPLLFNMTLDWALSAIPLEVGVSIGGTRYQYLAFADDVALLASTEVGLRRSVNSFVDMARRLGLEVGHSKCATLGILADGKKKTWFSKKVELQIDGQAIRALSPGKFYKYLGVQVGHTWASGPSHLLARYISGLSRLQRCPAKPQQKIWMLNNVLIPQMQYPMLHAKANKGTLKRLDVESRRFVRKALHLPGDTPVGYFHARAVDGGLGITAFTTRLPRLREDLMARLRGAADPSVGRAVDTVCSRTEEHSSASARRKKESEQWKASLLSSVDGRGLRGIDATPVSSSWIGDGTGLMRGRAFVMAVKVRGALLHTRLRASRAHQQPENIMCEKCTGLRPESLGHILQVCPTAQHERVKRHDRLLELYISTLQHHGYQVRREPAIPTVAGLRYPDIVCWRGNMALVVDVQVVADAAAGSLDESHRRKCQYYDCDDVRGYVTTLTGVPPSFSSFTVSWRGALATPSFNTWIALGLPKGALKLMIVRTLEGGSQIVAAHRGTSGGRTAGPGGPGHGRRVRTGAGSARE